MCKFNDKDVERDIIKGAEYLFLLQNNDGGIKYENASTPCSGIWVTAEALEFLLSSKNVPITFIVNAFLSLSIWWDIL